MERLHHRRSIRLKEYDYTKTGAYFITVCTRNRECWFGKIENGEMRLNEFGNIVCDEWLKTADLRPYVKLDEFIVMPNHFHGIVIVNHARRGTARRAPTEEQFGKPVSGSIPTIIRSFKSAVTKRINEIQNMDKSPVWQRNYYEHIIRTEIDLNSIRQYILDNPKEWAYDKNNPDNKIK